MGRGVVGRRGFSLLEVVVGVFILGVLFMPLSQTFVTGAKVTQYSEDYLRAVTVARSQIEMLRHAAKINKYAMERLVTAHAAAGGFKPFTVDGKYQVSMQVDPQFSVAEVPDLQGVPGGTDAVLLRVKVRVDWNVAGDPRHLELEALVDRAYN